MEREEGVGTYTEACEHREIPGVGQEEYLQRGYCGTGDDHKCVDDLRHCGVVGELGVGGECSRSVGAGRRQGENRQGRYQAVVEAAGGRDRSGGSGKTHKEKKITKKGRRELRWAMVEAAWRAIRLSPFWKEEYEKHLKRMRKPNQAIVGIARKLLVAIWHVLSKEETDIHASEEDLAYKMLLLSWSLQEETRRGLSYKQFAKYALMKLGVETDITRFVRRNVPRRLAPRDEVLARMTELGLSA